MAQSHIDIDSLLEDYAWRHFKDIQSLRKTRLDDFKSLEKEDVEFILVCFQFFRFNDVASKLSRIFHFFIFFSLKSQLAISLTVLTIFKFLLIHFFEIHYYY